MEEWIRYQQIRHEYSRLGWALVIYLGILNLGVSLVTGLESVYRSLIAVIQGSSEEMLSEIEAQVLNNSGWGYFLAIGVGAVFLLCWKKPNFCFDTLWRIGKPMKIGAFFEILAIFISGQLIFQLITMALELFFGMFGMSIMDTMASELTTMSSLSLLLYTGLGAPISEEILFRGLILRQMEPYGKKFAIFGSALLFGLFHGNLLQAPYAFGVGLVLGYVTLEYSIAWAMALHMFNNLILSDCFSRLTAGIPAPYGDWLIWGVIGLFSLAALVVVIVRWKQILHYLRQEKTDPINVKAFYSAPGMITIMLGMILTIAVSLLMMA